MWVLAGQYRACWTAAFLMLACAVCADAGAADSKRVMVLYSFGRDFKPWSEYAKTIRTELERTSPWPINLFAHSLDAARSGDPEVEQPFVEYLTALYATQPLDLIISIGAPAAAFVQRHRSSFFAGVSMVLTAIDGRRVQFSELSANDATVTVRIDYRAAFENILRLMPNTRSVVIVVGTSPIEKFWKAEIARELEPLAKRIDISWTDQLSFEEVLHDAAKLPPRTAIFWELMIADAAGVVHEGSTAISKLYDVANAPIFSYDESFFGREMVGGPFLHVIDTSRKTAEVATRILGGEKAGDIKVAPVEFGRPMYDWRLLQRWNISESRLPPGSDILFRRPSAWDLYRWQIVAIGLAVLLQATLIHWLLRERRQRRLSEALSRSTLSELARVNRIATGDELSASIAHEVMQPLTGMVSSANAGLRWLTGSPPDIERARAMLDQIVSAGHRAADAVRAIRSVFKREYVCHQPLEVNRVIAAVLDLVRSDLEQNNIEMKTRLSRDLPLVMADSVQLQQMLLNLVLNAMDAMKSVVPAETGLLRIRSRIEGDGIGIDVEDSGVGIHPDMLDRIFEPFVTTKREGLGLGLAICRSIVEVHGGRIEASLRKPRGLTVHVHLPATRQET